MAVRLQVKVRGCGLGLCRLSVTQKRRCSCSMQLLVLYKYYVMSQSAILAVHIIIITGNFQHKSLNSPQGVNPGQERGFGVVLCTL